MKIVIDIETDALVNPEHIWLIVCKDIDTGKYEIFRNVTESKEELERTINYFQRLRSEADSQLIGHNLLNFDYPVLNSTILLRGEILPSQCLDTLILSKLIDYSRSGHSIEDYGLEFGIPKGKFIDFSKYSQEMEDYCVRDVDICHRIYSKYSRYLSNPAHIPSIELEHRFQLVVNDLHNNGFSFNTDRARKLLTKVEADLAVLDKDILEAFPPKLSLIREITPKETKYGTLSKTDFRWLGDGDITEYNGGPFCRCDWQSFNPSSHKQIVSVLSSAGWRPIERTQSHIETERELNRIKYRNKKDTALDIRKNELILRLQELVKTGWKVNETNLETLPATAPVAARLLAKRIMLESRRRTLTEWLSLTWFELEVDTTAITIARGIKEKEPTLNGWPRSEVKGESINSPTLTNSEKTIRGTTSSTLMDCQSKTLLEWLKTKKVDVSSATKKENSTSITVIGRDQLEVFYAAIVTATSDGLSSTPLKYKLISERIHGKFYGLGAWSHRMAHQAPNTANIPKEFDTNGKKKLLGKELRSLWRAPENRLLVGVDAEGIQLRIFAHLINDPVLINALVNGKKEDKSDPHSHNQRVLGSVCRTRDAAKRFLYALFLGAGLDKLAAILDCGKEEAREALERLITQYAGWSILKNSTIPRDAERGWFNGLNGGRVAIPGDTVSQRKHLAMSGYLQHGEQVVVKDTTIRTLRRMEAEGYEGILVNVVHDEVVIEVPNDVVRAEYISQIFCEEITKVGIDLKLNCPLAGDGHVGLNWYEIH